MPFSVKKQFEGCTVLITGGTGFLGSVILEKLLRDCGVKKVYLAAIDNRGRTPEQALDNLLSRNLFGPVKEQYGDALKEHVELLLIDLSSIGPNDLPAVDYIIHTAASIRFDTHIHQAIASNYRTARAVAEAAMTMPNLKSFVHFSTCYVNGNLPKGSSVAEAVYPLGLDHQMVQHQQLVVDLINQQPKRAEQMAEALRAEWGYPNNYCLTKWLCEQVLIDYRAKGLPVRFLRPAIVGCTSDHHKVPGYLGNAAGATSMMLGIAHGLMTASMFGPDNITDIIPADCVANAAIMLAAAPERPEAKDTLPVTGEAPMTVQVSSSALNPMQNKMFHDKVYEYTLNRPVKHTVFSGYPKPTMDEIESSSMTAYNLGMLSTEARMQAKLLGMRVTGHGTEATKLKSTWEVFKSLHHPGIDFHLRFDNTRLRRIHAEVVPEEQEMFFCVWSKEESWDKYLKLYMGSAWDRYVDRIAAGQTAPQLPAEGALETPVESEAAGAKGPAQQRT